MWSALLPRSFLAWRERRQAFRDHDHIQMQEGWNLAGDESNLVNRAKVSALIDDLASAQRYWEEALVRYPNFAKTSHDALDILLRLRRYDEAEALMLEGKKRDPRSPFYAGAYALVAEHRGNVAEALVRWTRVRKKFPGYWMGHVHSAACLRQVGQVAAAEGLLRKAVETFPTEVRAFVEWARVADQRQDWLESIRRWDLLRTQFGSSAGVLGVAQALRELGRGDEADARLKEAHSRFPLDVAIPTLRARLAYERGDKEGALWLWAEVRRRFPLVPIGFQRGIDLLKELGRHEDAETIALAAIDRFPAQAWPAVEYASLAHKRQDWEAAVARWEAVRTGWPDRQDGFLSAAQALAALGRNDESAQLRGEFQRRVTPQPAASS
jgi:tetratricopeptide (TPR) repeat protein